MRPGVSTALITPFEDGAVDLDTFIALAHRQVNAGVAGLVPCGTTGETPTLNEAEWASLISAAVDVADGRVPVIAGCGSNSTANTVASLDKARVLGADAGLVVFPYYNKPNPSGLKAHVQACVRVGLPLVLYHVPGRTGQRLGAGQLAELCNVEGVIALKEATGDVALGQHMLEKTDRLVLSGDDFTFAPLMAMGGHGVISVVSNLAPRMTVEWAEAASSGDMETLRRLRVRLLPLVRALFAETNPVPTKAAMASMGLCKNELRLPLASGSFPDVGMLDGLH